MTGKKDKKTQSLAVELHTNPQLPTPWIDALSVAVRSDNCCALRFFTELPEGKFEQSRIITSKKQLKFFIDMLCSAINYHPVPKKSSAKGKST